MTDEPPAIDPFAVQTAAKLRSAYGSQAIDEAKARLRAATTPGRIDFWAAVCAALAVGYDRGLI